MSTPEASNSNLIKRKNSPFWNGINKSLLTPCRRVGLSRKRKITPTSLNTSSSCYSENEESPLIISKTVHSKNTTKDSSPCILLPENHYGSKKKLFQSFNSEDLFKPDDNNISCPVEEISVAEEISVDCSEVNQEIHNSASLIDIENKTRERRKPKKTVRLSMDFKADTVGEGSVNTNNIPENEEYCKEETSDNVNQIFDGNACIVSTSRKNCKVFLSKLSEEELQSVSSISSEGICSKTDKKSKSNIIDDADDFFTSTPEEEKVKRRNLEKQMRLLESQIKRKRITLENLQRASVYRSKHGLKDLKELTSLWMGGCVQALKDLLSQLQTHGSIDMNTLLSNLRIPQEMISKLSLEAD